MCDFFFACYCWLLAFLYSRASTQRDALLVGMRQGLRRWAVGTHFCNHSKK